ncbi:MAG: 4-(cytidine 5'-diphospho)-2-C-methyl-D-erythritol kinase [Deltaproteobacteria bacterium]|nr:4-(cytidine 5'-diphospho)-2-C-methyl-D-erythritol kinase [Deltaproteobacteria bacterium]
MNITDYTIKAPAKINIHLKVTGRRPDGYHELVSIMVPVEIFDIIDLKVSSDAQIRINCMGREIPADDSNLAYRAAGDFMSRAGIRDGISISLVKNIPVAAGLGGGSSDGAAVLLALNNMYSRPLSQAELHKLALNLGADVPFFLMEAPCLATGVGEILEPIRNWPEAWYIIVTPPIQVSTAWVYRNLKLKLTTGEYDYIVKTLKNGNFTISGLLENDLETVTTASFPLINTLKKLLVDAGAEGAIMSGSGPSVFGVFASREKAESAKDILASHNPGDVFLARGGVVKE